MKYIFLLLVLAFPLKAMSQLAMPIGGEQNKDWWIWSYFDNDSTVGSASNFKCSQYVYDNWFGLVFELKNLQLMDKGIPVLAAANGIVVSTHNGYPDRTKRSDTGGRGNYIRIQTDTSYTFYANLRDNSIRVKNNQTVKQGDTIAFVGSSGNVVNAKLYFRLEDSLGGKFRDPLGYQCGNPPYSATLTPGPIYDTLFGIIDEGITNTPAFTEDTLMERPPTLSEISLADDIVACAWIEFKNVFAQDLIQTIWSLPDGTPFYHGKFAVASNDDHVGYRSNWNSTNKLVDTGIYSVEWLLNGDSIAMQTFRVVQQHSGVAQNLPIPQTAIFPQPAKDHVILNGIIATQAHLYDIIGIEHPIRFEQNTDGTMFFWQDLPKGIYYLTIKDLPGALRTAKIIVSP
jgi:hypothetical protein